jgi:hypothetical protein
MQISESHIFNFNKMCKTIYGCTGKSQFMALGKLGFIMDRYACQMGTARQLLTKVFHI